MPDFKKYFLIPAQPEELYAALTFKPTIELWSGSPAEFVPEPNTEFSLWDQSITGKNLEFDPGKMIRQEWYFGEQAEPSIVTIKLHPDKKGTSMEVKHTNIPEQDYENIVDGWHTIYIKGLQDFYSE